MNMNRILFLIAMLTSFLAAQGNWEHYTKKDGLSSIWVQDVMEDSDGNLWFATFKGLNKYDGTNWTSYTNKDGLPDKNVLSLGEDKNGVIWIGTKKGLCQFIGEIFLPINNEDGASEYYYNIIENDLDNNLWIGGRLNKNEATRGIIYRYDGESLDSFTEISDIEIRHPYKIIPDSHGNIWINAQGMGKYMFKYDGNKWFSYGQDDGLFSGLMSRREIEVSLEDKTGNIWFGACHKTKEGSFTGFGSLIKYADNKWSTYIKEDGMIGNGVIQLAEDNSGIIWIGTTKGLSIFDGENWTNYDSSNGLPGDFILSIKIDSKNNIWIGTNIGLALFNVGNWKLFGDDILGTKPILDIFEDSKGNIWFSAISVFSKGGIVLFDGENWKVFKDEDNFGYLIHDIFEDKSGNIWFISKKGISKFQYE